MPVQIVGMRYGGAGVTADGEPVPFSLAGELVEVPADGPVSVVAPSPKRVEARCPHFGHCGGCHYQHAAYPEQLEIKRGILREILGFPDIEVLAGEPWGYRNRVRMRVETVDGVARMGYSRRGSNEFLPVTECPIAAPVLLRAVVALGESGQELLRGAKEVELFCSGDEAGLQISFSVRVPLRSDRFASCCTLLKAQVPELVGAGAALDADTGRRARKAWAGVAWGAPGLAYEAAGLRYWVSRGAFFQVNRFLVSEMLIGVTQGRAGRLAWDLFAGVGLFSKVLARQFEFVVAVEGSPVSAADLRQAGANVRAVQSSAVEFLRRAVLERERPQLVVVDPPRAGLGLETCALLGRVAAAEMVYVSCDPVTLGRDLANLTQAGYRVHRGVMIDMFPQTFHIETVVTLRRRDEALRV